MMEIDYVWDDCWDARFELIFQDGIKSIRQGDINRAAEIYFQNLEKYLGRNLLPVFPYAILLKALGKLMTMQGKFDPASTAFFFAADVYIHSDIQGEIDASLFHLGCCERCFLSTTQGVQYLACLKFEGAIPLGSPDSFIDLPLMRKIIARGRKTFLEYHRLLYKGREMKTGRDRDQELRNLIGHWIERYRDSVYPAQASIYKQRQ